MNRYDVASVAKFNPLSYQEIMAAPLAMRQKHDNAILAAEALRIKANPLDKHLNRALEIKNQMDAEIAKNVDTLNKEGYNPTTFQNITKLNRQYQDMISPTGEIGQINNAKIVYDKAQEDFIQDAAKQNIGRGRALDLWKEKTNYYTGFGEDGKSITNVSPQGVAAYQDYTKDKQVTHSILGKTIRGVSSQGHHLEVDKQTGGVWEVTRNGKRVTNDNTKQVEAALKSTLDKWDNPNGEGKRWLMDSGDGLNRDRIINDFNSMLETSDINDVSESANYNATNIGGDGSNPQGGGIFGEDYNTVEIGGNADNLGDISKIGKTIDSKIGYNEGDNFSPVDAGSGDKTTTIVEGKRKFLSKDIKDPKIKASYDKTFKDLSTKGVMIDGKLTFLKSDFVKKGKDDPATAALVLKAMKQNPITLTSKLLTTNQVLNDQGFVAGLGSTTDDVDKNIRRQLQRDDASGRKLVDPETGKTMTWNEASKEYGFESINDVNYQGQISAHNWEEDNDKLGTNSRFSPHVVTIKDKNGKWRSFKTTRLNSDNIGGNVARQNDLTKNYRKATLNHGDFIDFESSSNNLNGIEVKYNPKEQEYDSKTGEPKTWTIKFKNGAEEKATESQYMNWVNSVK